jgi:hypothetical protein
VRELPPLDFGYSRFTPEARRLFPLAGTALPMTSLANPDLELVDLFCHGLPDILELGSQPRYWRKLGDGRFDRLRGIPKVPAGVRLTDRGVQLIDANGDGRVDLLVTSDALSGYYPLDFRAGFSKRSFQRYQPAPNFDLEDPETRLVDLTGDGVTDVLRSNTSFECYFNDPTDGWLHRNTARVPRVEPPAGSHRGSVSELALSARTTSEVPCAFLATLTMTTPGVSPRVGVTGHSIRGIVSRRQTGGAD